MIRRCASSRDRNAGKAHLRAQDARCDCREGRLRQSVSNQCSDATNDCSHRTRCHVPGERAGELRTRHRPRATRGLTLP